LVKLMEQGKVNINWKVQPRQLQPAAAAPSNRELLNLPPLRSKPKNKRAVRKWKKVQRYLERKKQRKQRTSARPAFIEREVTIGGKVIKSFVPTDALLWRPRH